MDTSSDQERLIALRNELLVTRNELQNLQSARSVRAAKFTKRMLRSRISEWPVLLKDLPDVFKKLEPPRLENLTSEGHLFNSVNKPLPLFVYPNINVAVIGGEVERLFSLTCNAIVVGSIMHKTLLNYGALQLIAVEIGSYKPELHKNYVQESIDKGAHLIYFYNNSDSLNNFLKSFPTDKKSGFCLDPSQKGSILNNIDIYGLSSYEVSISGVVNVYSSPACPPLNSQSLNILNLKTDPSQLKPNSLIVINDKDLTPIKGPSKTLVKKITRLIALGVPIVIYGKLPNWIVRDVACFNNITDLQKFIYNFQTNPYQAERYSVACRRSTILEYNAAICVGDILKRIGFIGKNDHYKPTISVLLATKRPGYIKRAIQQLESQTIKPHEVLLLAHGVSKKDEQDIIKLAKKSALSIRVQNIGKDVVFGEVLNSGLDKACGEFVTKIDDDDYYSPNHLLDLYVAYLHSCADMVGKWNNWVYLKNENKVINWVPEMANSYVRHLPGGTFLARTTMLQKARFGLVKHAIDSELYQRIMSRGATLYSTHRYNYVRVRDNGHTYKTTDADFKSRAHPVMLDGLDLKNQLSI